MSVGPYAFDGTSTPISIAVSGHVANNDGGYAYFFENSDTGDDPSGTITISNSSTDSAAYAGAYGRKSAGGWTMTFDHVTITNPNRLGLDPHFQVSSATGVAIFGGSTGTPGGVAFESMSISNAAGNAMVDYYRMDDDPIQTTFSCTSCTGATNSSASKSYP
ncbi:MAG TPA: hypothetical protein VH143_29280 [Kofleriaceae bacterium]|jgi:hypothetical protein|nr:hypothetical protein [Kofleriaceae bacterium]